MPGWQSQPIGTAGRHSDGCGVDGCVREAQNKEVNAEDERMDDRDQSMDGQTEED